MINGFACVPDLITLLKVVDLINTAQLEEKDNKLECLRKV